MTTATEVPTCSACNGLGEVDWEGERLPCETCRKTRPSPLVSDPCARCGGHRHLYSRATSRHDGPRCPHCHGTGMEPKVIGPQRHLVAIDDPSVAQIVAALERLRLRREDWQYARSDDANNQRVWIFAGIKDAYWDAFDAGLRIEDIADLLGISRQRLDKIRKMP